MSKINGIPLNLRNHLRKPLIAFEHMHVPSLSKVFMNTLRSTLQFNAVGAGCNHEQPMGKLCVVNIHKYRRSGGFNAMTVQRRTHRMYESAYYMLYGAGRVQAVSSPIKAAHNSTTCQGLFAQLQL